MHFHIQLISVENLKAQFDCCVIKDLVKVKPLLANGTENEMRVSTEHTITNAMLLDDSDLTFIKIK